MANKREANENDARELYFHLINEPYFSGAGKDAVIKTLKRHHNKGQYTVDGAIRAWKNFATRGANDYAMTYGGIGDKGTEMFSLATREMTGGLLENYYRDAVKRKNNPAKKRRPKKPARSSSQYVTRRSQATKKPPTKRLKARRKKAQTGPEGYFPNPINGTKTIKYFAIFSESEKDGNRFYFAGYDGKGQMVFEDNIKRAVLFPSKTGLAHAIKPDIVRLHQKSGRRFMLDSVTVGGGEVIPGE